MKPQPKIKMGSSPILTAAAKVIIRLGTSVFPEARIALLPTIGITRKIIPVYQMVMYSPTRERTSGLVPKALNKSSIVASPTTINMPTINRDRVRLLVVSFFHLVVSSSPIARAITEEAPTPSPIATLPSTVTTGKYSSLPRSLLFPVETQSKYQPN
jgi:hypothetical protein